MPNEKTPVPVDIAAFLLECKPCPFCGGKELTLTDWWDDEGEFLAVACTGCKAEAPAIVWNRTEGRQ